MDEAAKLYRRERSRKWRAAFLIDGQYIRITIHERGQCLDDDVFRRYIFDWEIDKPGRILFLKPFFLDFENNKAGEFYLAIGSIVFFGFELLIIVESSKKFLWSEVIRLTIALVNT